MTIASEIRGAVHSNTRHDSAHNHVAGQSVFIDDMPSLAGTLHAALVKSPHAHARIKSIDVTKAASLPGVKAVLTASDIPGRNFKSKDALVEHLEDCRRMDVEVVPPNVNHSQAEFAVEKTDQGDRKIHFLAKTWLPNVL